MVDPSLAELPDRPGVERPPAWAARQEDGEGPPAGEQAAGADPSGGLSDQPDAGAEDARPSLGFVMV